MLQRKTQNENSARSKRVTIVDDSSNGGQSWQNGESKPQKSNDTCMGSMAVLDVEKAHTPNAIKIGKQFDESIATPNPLQPIRELDILGPLLEASLNSTNLEAGKDISAGLSDFGCSDGVSHNASVLFLETIAKQPLFSYSFRFINYNMANNDHAMDNIGSGFVLRRAIQSTTTPSTPDSLPSEESSQCNVSLSSLMRFGVQWPPMDARNSYKYRMNKAKTGGLLRSLTASLKRTKTLRSTSRSTATSTTTDVNEMRPPAGRSSTVTSVTSVASNWFQTTTVDCVFGCLCETQFEIEEYARSHGLQNHFSSVSAQTMLSELGAIEGMKGMAIGKMHGDLKAFMFCSDTFEEEDDNIFCSYDNASQGVSKGNPVKSFLGKTFTVASGTLRITCLGTHFPMQKVSSLMEDTSISEDDVLQKVKCLFARCLQKILRHLLLEGVMTERSMIILQGDLNSRCLKSEGLFVDALWETLQDVRLQEFISSDLPQALRGEWREVIPCAEPGDLPVTYRFQQNKPPGIEAFRFPLDEVYNFSSKTETNYQQLLEGLKKKGTVDDWGLYGAKIDSDGSKFKPSRLPACTERVLYYAPAYLLDCCQWETSWGYEVNYSWTGSDHKPVVLEATLKLYNPEDRTSLSRSQPVTASARAGKCSSVPVDFEKRLMSDNESPVESEDSDEFNPPPKDGFFDSPKTEKPSLMPRSRTGIRLSMNGPMQDGLLWK